MLEILLIITILNSLALGHYLHKEEQKTIKKLMKDKDEC